MFGTKRPTWRITISALPILALLLALTIAPALAQEEVTGNYYTIKYDQHGNKLWHAIYDGGNWDYAYDVAVDSEGNVIVTGASEISHVYHEDGEAVGTGNGTTTVFNLKHPAITPESETISLDGGVTTDYQIDYTSGAVTFTVAPGEGVVITADYDYGEINNDCYTIKYNSNGQKLWEMAYDNGGRDEAYGVAVDSDGNIIVTGFSFNGTDNDYCTIKYDPDGKLFTGWTTNPAIYNGGGEDNATAVAVDSGNNIIVTGYSYDGSVYNYYTIKYNPGGDQIWHKVYDSLSTLTEEAVGSGDGSTKEFTLKHLPVIPESETIYLDDESQERNSDYTIANDTGTITFAAAPEAGVAITADYTVHGNDCAQEVAVDSDDNIIVTGSSIGLEQGATWYSCTIKYDSNGEEVWAEPAIYHGIYEGKARSITAFGAAVDSLGNVVITASYYTPAYVEEGTIHPRKYNRYITIKYGKDDGEELWSAPIIYDGGKDYDCAYDVAVVSEDNIIVTGCSGGDYCTVKYNGTDGSLFTGWTTNPVSYDSGEWDAALDLAVDSDGNIIVAGSSQGASGTDGNGGTPADGGGLPAGAILGIALGGCAAIGLAYYYLFYLRGLEARQPPRSERRRKAAKERKRTRR